MKKVILVLVICFIGLSSKVAYSQINKSILDTTKQWNIMRGVYSEGYNSESTQLFRISPEDTIINNNQYYRLQQVYNYDTSQVANWQNIDWIREENGLVYVFTYNPTNAEEYSEINYNPSEYILFDFNLSLGDTFVAIREVGEMNNNICSSDFIVSEIDSIEIGGEYYKRISFSGWDEIWIEGIGSNVGLLTSCVRMLGLGSELLCLHQEDELVYNTGRGCYINAGIENVLTENKQMNIFPTIVKDYINIETTINGNLKVVIIDIYGRIIKRKSINNSCQIGINNMPNGIYNCIFYKEGSIFYSQKIIKI